MTNSDNNIFLHVAPNPCNGAWINIDDVASLVDAIALLPERLQGADEYGVSDAEGLAIHFTTPEGHFIFDQCSDCMNHEGDDGAKIAYIENFGEWNSDHFDDAYDSDRTSSENPELEFAEQLIDDTYNLDEIMGNLSGYFDYERFARDLFINDYTEINGYIFHNC